MKKRILAILLTASLLVGAMAAVAFAEISAMGVDLTGSDSSSIDDSTPTKTYNFTVKMFGTQTISINVTRGNSDTHNLTAVPSSNLSLSATSHTGSDASSKTWELKVTANSGTSGTVTITETNKNWVATVDFTIDPANKPSFDVVQTNLDIGALWDTTNKVFYGGTRVTSADFSKDVGANASVKFFTASFDNYTHATGTKLVGTINPTTSGLNFYAVSKDGAAPNGHDGKLYGFLSGDVAANASGKYTLTVEATDAAGTTKSVYYFNVKPRPTITVTAPNDIVWGKAWTFTPQAKDVTSWDVVVSADDLASYLWDDTRITDHAKYVSADVLKKSADIDFKNSNGMLSGTWKTSLESDDGFTSLDAEAWTSGTVATKKIRLVAYNGSGPKAGRTTADYTLKFVGVAPTLDKTASQMTSSFNTAKFMYGTGIPTSKDQNAVVLTATAPGRISWDVKGLPEGLESEDEMIGYTSQLRIYGSPDITVKNQKVTIKAYNPFSKTGITIEPTISVGSDTFYLFVSNDTAVSKDKGAEDLLPSGDKKVGDEFTTINLRALPGPVEWDDKNLPDGVLLVVSTDDPTAATLSGTFLDGRASKTDINYAIKATNSVISKTDTLSQDLMVYETPVFGDAYLFNKKATINTGTTLSFPLTVAGFPDKTSWDIAINGTTIIQNSTPVTTPTDYSKGWQPTTYAGTGFAPKTFLSVDLAALSKDETLKFVGSLDVVPTDGTFTVTVTARNLATGTTGVTEQYIVAVKGTAPTLKKEDITLSSTSTNKAMKITGGNAPVTMTAYIDSKTAKKVFGIEEDIDLTTANISGIIFSSDLYGNGSFDYGTDTNHLASGVIYSSVAYNKLPITVTAVNPDISDKIANAKYTVTIAGTSPYWNVSNDLSEYKPNPAFSTSTTTGTTLGTSHALTAEANKPLSADTAYVVFKPQGSGPFDITVKPMTKNGLTAVVDDSGNVTIAGTPTATKKDVVTKFSLTLKNPSTGDTAKSDLAITAKPKPEAAGSISKTLIIGKNLKLAPKAKVSNNGMEWAISTISRDNQAITEEALESTYGIDFDKTKGTLSGTTLAATGTDKPIIVTMYASSDVANSDPITATITILGAKPKLTTKKISLLIDGSDINNARIDTNLTGETDTNKANVQFTPTSFSDALSGINATKAGNSLTFSGSPSAVTKKQTVEFALDNYGSEGKGKVAFTVVGSKPQVTGNNAITLAANSSTTTTLSLNNSDKVGNKVKWKISTKPGNGVSAKVKGDVNGATVTIKAKKKATAGTTTFAVTATDSISKTTSDPYEITVTVTDASSTSEAPLETKDAATEAEAENEIALGEGEVTFGAERTAGSLTAAQRRVIAEQGYVIAAVLPEIEVTADGQYDFEVDLDEEVAAGAELVWFAFSSKPTTDDEIVDFADENNEETKVVPESHVVIVTPWLNAGAKYAPVIAVKADASEADATTAEGVKEAAEEKAE